MAIHFRNSQIYILFILLYYNTNLFELKLLKYIHTHFLVIYIIYMHTIFLHTLYFYYYSTLIEFYLNQN